MLGRVESPGFQHTAVMVGCVEPSELHLLPTIIEIPHTLVDIYQSGALLLVRVESPIAAHSSSTGWRGVALPGTVFVDGGVMSSYRCSRDRKYLSRGKKSEAQLVANTYWNMTIQG